MVNFAVLHYLCWHVSINRAATHVRPAQVACHVTLTHVTRWPRPVSTSSLGSGVTVKDLAISQMAVETVLVSVLSFVTLRIELQLIFFFFFHIIIVLIWPFVVVYDGTRQLCANLIWLLYLYLHFIVFIIQPPFPSFLYIFFHCNFRTTVLQVADCCVYTNASFICNVHLFRQW